MPIAAYTRKLMDQLADTGACIVRVTESTPDPVARTRISNAARRSGLKVRSAAVDIDGRRFILGEVVPETDLSPAAELRTRGYQVKPVPFESGVRVAYILSDKTNPHTVNVLGDWETAEEAIYELTRSGWPTNRTMLEHVRELHKGE